MAFDGDANTPEHFEYLGPNRVRFLLSRQGVDEKFSTPAVEWLAARDRAEKTEQNDIARSSKRAAWLAAWLAFAAVLIGIGAWCFPKADTKPSLPPPQARNLKGSDPAKLTRHVNPAK